MMAEDTKVEDKPAADVEADEPQSEQPEAKEDDQGGVTLAGIHVSDQQLPLVETFFAGVILLASVLAGGRSLKFWEYTISVAVVAMFFSLVGFVLTWSKDLYDKFGSFNAMFLFVWCFIGACILTFAGPFQTTSNGYFSAWALVVFSAMSIGVTGAAVKGYLTGMGALMALEACSIVVIVAIIPEMQDNNKRNQGIYALCVSCITVVVAGFFSKMGDKMKASKVKFIILACFAIMWIILACVVTFQGPFIVTGNGYFASWGGAVASIFAAMATLKE